jgi:DNA-binding NtrC family response regulator
MQLSQIVETFRTDYDRTDYCGFIGSSMAMQEIYRIIDQAAPSKATVTITGESGTGKEVCAEAIHKKSPRNDKPFIALNCGAIPKDLMESEIFGHVKGSFTGAMADRDGAATRADGGTLFLDEICEMDPALQVKLLRFIQTRSFQKVGGSKLQEVDVRFVCATNRNPWAEVQAGRFREDLFYRLNVIPVHLPTLAEREKDVIEIAEHFLSAFSKEEGKEFTNIASDVVDAFLKHKWPGNVRQLQNIIRNVVVLHEGPAVTFDMLPTPFNQPSTQSQTAPGPVADTQLAIDGPSDFGAVPTGGPAVELKPLWQVEHDFIKHALDACDGNVQRAATILELSPSTLYRRLRDLKSQAAAQAAE